MPSSEYIDETVKVVTSSRLCSRCGLHVPEELDACPNDGTAMAKAQEPAGAEIPPAYEFIEYIGKGGMSVIYKARHRYMKNVVAIKLLQDRLSQDKASFQRFRQEAEASKKLDHPNVIRVDDFGVLEHGAAFLVMDFVEGRSLAEVIAQDGALTVERALPLFMQISAGLAHAHNKGVLHRDLKPSNVLVVREPESDGTTAEHAKIVDFGIAKMITGDGSSSDASRLTTTGEVFGSPAYMSPEQCMGNEVDARSDVYSMGCLMYEALTGKPPFTGANPMETMFKQLNAEPEPLSNVIEHPRAAELQKVIGRAMDKDRSHRYQTFDELRDDLHKVERGTRVRGLRTKLPVFKLAAAGVLIAIGVVAWMETHRPAPVQNPLITIREMLAEKEPTVKNRSMHGVLCGLTDAWCAANSGKNFKYVNLRGNHAITTSGASAFLRTPDLAEIWLEDTLVDDAFMTNLAKAHPPLVKLGIGETHITGRSLPLLANFPAITQLNAETLNLTDEDMDHFPEMPALEVLKLDNNTQLTNHAIEVILRNCPRIKLLTLRKTSVDNGGVAIARAARHKFTLAVADSHVTDFHDDNLLTITDTVPADWRIKEMGERAANAVGGRIPHRKNKMSAEIQK